MTIGIKIAVEATRYGGLDPSAVAFLTAAGITDATITNAIDRLVKNYKGQGNLNNSVDLWTGTSAIYPFVGGTATTNKFNLKDPRDIDAAFRLSFSGGWTHNANGITGNGVNTSANTFFNPNTGFTASNGSIGVYSRSNINESKYDFGCTQAITELIIICRNSDLQYANYGSNASYGTVANTDSRGWFETARNGDTNTLGRKNGITVITHTETENRPNLNLFIGATNNSGTPVNFASKNYAFAKIGQGLNDTNAFLEYQIIQQFQTDLGRQV